MKKSILAILVGVLLFILLPNDTKFHIQGFIAGLLCVGGGATLLMLLAEPGIIRREMERRELGFWAKFEKRGDQ